MRVLGSDSHAQKFINNSGSQLLVGHIVSIDASNSGLRFVKFPSLQGEKYVVGSVARISENGKTVYVNRIGYSYACVDNSNGAINVGDQLIAKGGNTGIAVKRNAVAASEEYSIGIALEAHDDASVGLIKVDLTSVSASTPGLSAGAAGSGDTLQSVTDNGSVTNHAVTVGGLVSDGDISISHGGGLVGTDMSGIYLNVVDSDSPLGSSIMMQCSGQLNLQSASTLLLSADNYNSTVTLGDSLNVSVAQDVRLSAAEGNSFMNLGSGITFNSLGDIQISIGDSENSAEVMSISSSGVSLHAPLGIASGGTGLNSLGSPGQVPTVKSDASGLEWTTISTGGGSGGAEEEPDMMIRPIAAAVAGRSDMDQPPYVMPVVFMNGNDYTTYSEYLQLPNGYDEAYTFSTRRIKQTKNYIVTSVGKSERVTDSYGSSRWINRFVVVVWKLVDIQKNIGKGIVHDPYHIFYMPEDIFSEGIDDDHFFTDKDDNVILAAHYFTDSWWRYGLFKFDLKRKTFTSLDDIFADSYKYGVDDFRVRINYNNDYSTYVNGDICIRGNARVGDVFWSHTCYIDPSNGKITRFILGENRNDDYFCMPLNNDERFLVFSKPSHTYEPSVEIWDKNLTAKLFDVGSIECDSVFYFKHKNIVINKDKTRLITVGEVNRGGTWFDLGLSYHIDINGYGDTRWQKVYNDGGGDYYDYITTADLASISSEGYDINNYSPLWDYTAEMTRDYMEQVDSETVYLMDDNRYVVVQKTQVDENDNYLGGNVWVMCVHDVETSQLLFKKRIIHETDNNWALRGSVMLDDAFGYHLLNIAGVIGQKNVEPVADFGYDRYVGVGSRGKIQKHDGGGYYDFGQVAKVGGNIGKSTSQKSNTANTNEQILDSIDLADGTFSDTSVTLYINSFWKTSADANLKRFLIKLGYSDILTLFDSGDVALDNEVVSIECWVSLKSGTTIQAITKLSSPTKILTSSVEVESSEIDIATSIRLVGQSVAGEANEITLLSWRVDYLA